MSALRHMDVSSAWNQERQPLLGDQSATAQPRYDATSNGTNDKKTLPLLTRGTRPSSSFRQPDRNSSDLTVRVQAVCPNIHCPSCISHLSTLVSSLRLDPSTHARIENVDTSLIDRSIHFDLVLSSHFALSESSTSAGGTSSARAATRLLTRIVKELASILAEDGFPVDHLRSKLVSVKSADRAYRDALNLVLDASDLYESELPSASAHSLPKDGRTNLRASKSRPVLGTFPASLGSTLRSA